MAALEERVMEEAEALNEEALAAMEDAEENEGVVASA